ncbi:hypothetical protein [Streptomyces alkaliphilus]|uniref:hypothetical protein n=1 Tax=Streptomyces alkaliphilus TaxID=1472722 RepID=UPI00117D809D|nr:hypothetical protein [Streptomyces alkaliphilus]MQS09618.1 hypothetical protein [Streptomyces alkaliphilus]
MAALVWLLIPLVGVLIAGVWSIVASRRMTGARRADDTAGVRRHQAFREAMERPVRGADGLG